MTLILQGLSSPLLVVQGLGGASAVSISFREALVAKLSSIADLAAVVGAAIYPGAVPQTHDFGRDGPALVYNLIDYRRGSALAAADGTASARVQLDLYGYQLSAIDRAARAIVLAINGPPVSPWAPGAPVILSCSHQGEHDMDEPPKAGTDQWTYRIMSEYLVRHRVPPPTIS